MNYASIKLFNGKESLGYTGSDPHVILAWLRSTCAESGAEGSGRARLVSPVKGHRLVREGGQWALSVVWVPQEREWGAREPSHPRSHVSAWAGRQMWVPGFTKERIQ